MKSVTLKIHLSQIKSSAFKILSYAGLSVSQLPTFEHFHNIHQIKVEESLDALPAKLYKNPENLPQKSKYKCVKLRAKERKKEIHHVRKCTGHQV